MRFMTRSLLAVGILALTLALLGLGLFQIASAVKERQSRESRQRPAQERVFSVNVDTIRLAPAKPIITVFGEAKSWRALELRTAASGTLIEISDQFRDGGFVARGALLYRIDPADATADVQLAETQVKEAQAELLEAEAALELAKIDLEAATEQRALRQAALTRQEGLKTRGVGTDSAVEAASLSLSSSVQTELARKQSLAQAQARILRAEIGLQRQEIALAEAQRRLSETEVTAPFDGILADVEAITGRQVGNNELLGTLIDPAAIEVAFRVSNEQFARLVGPRGALRPVDVTAVLDLPQAPITVTGRVDRAGAEVGDGQTGRLIYARLNAEEGRALRPGDFLRVEIAEPELTNVAVIPATAAQSDGFMLLLAEGDRLEAHKATILRRQTNDLIVTDVPEGREYVQRLQPQLGVGIKVKPIRPGATIEAVKMVELDDARRAKLIAFVEANTRMPAQAKKAVLGRLNEKMVPEETVARLESRMNGGGGDRGGSERGGGQGGGSGPAENAEMVTLAPERAAKLIAAVEANDRMPAEAKERVLGLLRGGAAPADMIARLESRMSGDDAAPQSPRQSSSSDGGGETIALDDGRRARLVAFVKENQRMPAEAKTRILAQLEQEQVPADLITRLESRMGG